MDSPSSPGLRRILSSAVVLAVIFVLSTITEQPPAPQPARVASTQFSAARALETLRRILKEDVPHPAGSAADALVRQRILDEFTTLGYEPQVQTAFTCSNYASCATVNNVVARLEGTGAGGAVLVAAHYDSVPAGPGDSDDGTGIATVLEIARALKSLRPRAHPVIFLLDEGEEDGLLGAQGFVDSHPWAKEVRVAVNVDNRGTHGSSFMFETGSANSWAARFYAQHVPHPRADSIFYAIYKLLPNDTDFTIFKAAGYQGLNFAYIRGVNQYHTPLDDAANVAPASVQNHGNQMLPLVAALADADLSNLPKREEVYFTIFGHWMVYWPARLSVVFAFLAVLLLIAQIAWLIYVQRLALRELLWGILAWPVVIGVTAGVALVIERIVHIAGATPVAWIAYPIPLEISFVLVAMVIVVTNAILFYKRARFWGLWCGVWTWWVLLALIASLRAPGLSHTLLVPAGLAVSIALVATIKRTENSVVSGIAAIVPLAAAGIVLMPLILEMYTALGGAGLVPIAVLAALLFTPATPVCGDLTAARGLRGLAVPWIVALLAAVFLFAAIVVPVYSAKAPERLNFLYVKDGDSGNANWVAEPDSGRLPEPIRLTTKFHRADKGYFPWDTKPAFIADAPHSDLAAPTFTVLESSESNGRRRYRALLRSERGAAVSAVFFPPGSEVDSVAMGGIPEHPEPPGVWASRHRNWFAYSCTTMAAAGVELSFSLPLGRTVEVSALDESFELPSEGAFLLHARPLTATPSQNGDVTVVTRRVQLLP